MGRVSAVVWRQEKITPTCVTVISADRNHIVKDGRDLQRLVTAAVTGWMKAYASGRSAYESAGDDFNVGDLGSYVDDPDLQCVLYALGVIDLRIEQPDVTDWNYDTPLTEYVPEDDE